jgi:hypothetical protein
MIAEIPSVEATLEEYTVAILGAVGVLDCVFGPVPWEEVRVWALQAQSEGHTVEVERVRGAEPTEPLRH